MICQINEPDKLRALMILIGEKKIVSAFEKNIGPWSGAKMSKFVAFGLGIKEEDKKGGLYYKDGPLDNNLVLYFPIEFILECR